MASIGAPPGSSSSSGGGGGAPPRPTSYGASETSENGEGAGGGGGNRKVADLQSQVNDVKDVMSRNIENVMKRGDNLDDLVTKTTDLEAGAAVFRDRTKTVRRKMWWKNAKMNIIIGIVVVVIIVIIILSTVDLSPSSSSSITPEVTTKLTPTKST
jgi:hypothetical protein